MHRIELRNVTKRFGSVTAVDHVDLVIEKGDFLTLLGPSGCGKTTILRMIAGLEDPDGGEILIDDRVVSSHEQGIFVAPADRGFGLVFQSYALWPHMTVFQNAAFGLKIAKRPKEEIRQRVGAILADLQIADMADRYPQEMSGGQQQRVALARMLVPQPGIFLLDEPLSNLDARLRVDMRSELKRLHRTAGATALYVTHDQTEALTMSTHIAVMRAGRLEQVAPPMRVYRCPATLFVADFIGSPKTNLLDATAVHEGGTTTAVLKSLTIGGLAAEASGPVVVAVRPEDVRLSLQPEPGAYEFVTYSVLPSGSETILNVQRGSLLLTVKDTRDLEIEMDRPIWVTFDPHRVNLYDKATGKLLEAAARPTSST
jgi:multiple sugar transport system ATP-binding protein